MRTTDWPPRYIGRPGQGPPRRFNALTWLKLVPGLIRAFEGEVPAEMWTEDFEDGQRFGVVSCPCGAEAKAREDHLSACERCERVFLLIGDRIKVARAA
jgi:hypothetical protein